MMLLTDLRQELDVKDKLPSQTNSAATTPTNTQSIESRLQGHNNNNIKSSVVKNGVTENTSANHIDQQNVTITPSKGKWGSGVHVLVCVHGVTCFVRVLHDNRFTN